METKTPKEFFEKALPSRFKPEKAAGVDVTVQINLTGSSDGGDWVITLKNQKIQAAPGTTPEPTLTLKTTEADFMDLVNGKISAEKAFFSGKVNFRGNIATALKLRDAGFL
jgi:putative sterol carrier protein